MASLPVWQGIDKAVVFEKRREPEGKALELTNAEEGWFEQEELQPRRLEQCSACSDA
jgi:hypothetical protein